VGDIELEVYHPARHALRRQLRAIAADHPLAERWVSNDDPNCRLHRRLPQDRHRRRRDRNAEKLGFDTGLR
jgi:hypothetical protein